MYTSWINSHWCKQFCTFSKKWTTIISFYIYIRWGDEISVSSYQIYEGLSFYFKLLAGVYTLNRIIKYILNSNCTWIDEWLFPGPLDISSSWRQYKIIISVQWPCKFNVHFIDVNITIISIKLQNKNLPR